MIEESNCKIESSVGPHPRERRGHSRYPFTATVEAVEPKSRTLIQGRTSDLSRGGCYVDTINFFPPGSIVKMRLTKETRSFETQAQVVYSVVGMGMGVKFIDADPEQLRTVENWVGEVSGQLLPEPELPRPSDCTPGRMANEALDVLNELVMELMRQRVLSNAKCQAMLRKLNHTGHAKSSFAHV
jgi:hypothetical protein